MERRAAADERGLRQGRSQAEKATQQHGLQSAHAPTASGTASCDQEPLQTPARAFEVSAAPPATWPRT